MMSLSPGSTSASGEHQACGTHLRATSVLRTPFAPRGRLHLLVRPTKHCPSDLFRGFESTYDHRRPVPMGLLCPSAAAIQWPEPGSPNAKVFARRHHLPLFLSVQRIVLVLHRYERRQAIVNGVLCRQLSSAQDANVFDSRCMSWN